MATCLGISTENNLIKYAKVSLEHDFAKINSFGIKFYDDLEKSLKEILEETSSHNIPICMNLTGETYNYFSVFNMLKKKDIASVLNSEFELLCEEKGYSYNTLDSRYLLTQDYMNKEKSKAIYISVERADITAKMQKMQEFRVGKLVPVPVALTNLVRSEKENYGIINIEEDTKIITVVNNQINDVETVNLGMKDIISKINEKENSIQKSYEVCKNTTIYTMETSDTQLVENVYLKDIMPVLYKIVTAVKDKFENQLLTVRKMYITGSAAVINNIDLYFQEYLPTYKCEILSPYFIDKTSANTNVKDYIEVNSAIAVAIQGIGEKYKDVNFKNNYLKSTLSAKSLQLKMNSDIKLPTLEEFTAKFKKKDKSLKKTSQDFNTSLKGPITAADMGIIRVGMVGILCMSIFGVGSTYLKNEINQKMSEADLVISGTEKEIATIRENTDKVKSQTNDYSNRTSKLQNLTNQVIENNRYKKAIPILLNRIMSVVPKEVKLTSIENNTDGKIIINAEAQNYDDLGYFKATLKTKNILNNISSDSSIKLDNVVKVTIEGELP